MLTTAVVALLVLLGLGIPVAAVLFVLANLLGAVYVSAPITAALGSQLWDASTNFILVSIPLFILIGEILLRSGIAAKVYEALDDWLSWLPGGLMHANIGTSTFFAATSGSSVATAAMVGTLAMPQAVRFGYDERFFAGSIAAGGTLGILIPPSINLIIYGFMTGTSIPDLFLAGIIPGLLLSGMFMLTIAIFCTLRPAWGGPRRSATMRKRLRGLIHLVPVLILFAFIVGSIYGGWATPTEAAAIGSVVALGLAAAFSTIGPKMLVESLTGTIRITAMIMLILLAANFLNFVLAMIGLTDQLIKSVAALNLSAGQTMALLIAFYVVLGFFIETLSLMIITIPLVTPLVVALGFDPVWFGIVLIVLVEMALITPPVGFNLFVVQGVRGRGNIQEVAVGAIPFVIAMLVLVGLLILFPQLALYIPQQAAR